MKKNILQITNDKGITFNAIVNKNKKEGDTITFYDSRYKKNFGTYGQNVATYYVSTLMGKDKLPLSESIKGKGLNLYGGVEDWYLTKQNTNDIIDFLERNNYE
tara:strand:- start:2148 stop:2456 length:309 start_codon:yes stop_codon:yes gene_type:complete